MELRSLLGEAVRLHQAGRLEQASLLYHQALAADPRNAYDIHLMGLISLQQERPRDAVELIGKALVIKDNEAS